MVVLAAIGLRFLLRVSVLAWKKLIGPSFGFGIDLRTQGKWAVITGATSGIGKAYAEQLAEKGLSIVLVSRTQAKLEQVAVEIKQRYGVEVRIVEADLTEGQVAYTRIAKATEELEVFVLSPFSYPLSLSFLFRSIHPSIYPVRSFVHFCYRTCRIIICTCHSTRLHAIAHLHRTYKQFVLLFLSANFNIE